jgi:hypothetical protein
VARCVGLMHHSAVITGRCYTFETCGGLGISRGQKIRDPPFFCCVSTVHVLKLKQDNSVTKKKVMSDATSKT